MPISNPIPIPIPKLVGLVTSQIRPQRERAIRVRLLMAGPSHRVSNPLYLELRFELEPFPFCALRQHELSLPDLAGQRVTRIQTASHVHVSVVTDHIDPQGPGNSCDSVVGETEN